jgi:hypothetical protein
MKSYEKNVATFLVKVVWTVSSLLNDKLAYTVLCLQYGVNIYNSNSEDIKESLNIYN